MFRNVSRNFKAQPSSYFGERRLGRDTPQTLPSRPTQHRPCLSLHSERIFLSSPRMIQTVINEREQWSCFSSQSDKFVPKSRKLFSAFLCRSSLANSDIIKNPNLGEAGRGKLSSTKKLSQAFLFAYQFRSFKHILVLNQRNGPQYRLSHVGTMRSFNPCLKQNSWIKNLHTWRMPITFVVLKGSREGWH